MDTIDPNLVIVLKNDENALNALTKILKHFNLRSITTPGSDTSSKFIFLRVNNQQQITDLNRLVNSAKDQILDIFPLYDNDKTLQLQNFYRKVNGNILNFHKLESFEINLLNQITCNLDQSLFLAFFNNYNAFLKKLSIIGAIFYVFSANDKQFEFSNFFTLLSLFMSLNFVANWIYKDEKEWIKKLSMNGTPLTLHFAQWSNLTNTKFSNLSTVLTMKVLEIPIIFAFVLTLIIVQLFCFSLEIFFTQFYSGSLRPILSLLPTIIMILFTPILTKFYNNFFVDKFIKLENGKYPKVSKLEKNFILLFFVNYMPLLITLFFYLPFGYLFPQNIHLFPFSYLFVSDILNFKVNINRHKSQFFYFTFTNQIISYATEYILPIILTKLQKKKLKDDLKVNKIADTIKNEYNHCFKYWKKAENYNGFIKDTFDVDSNYQKLILQFGFITMFCSIWPLAPLIVYVINQILFKTTLWKAIQNSRPTMIPITNDNPNDTQTSLHMKPWNNILKVIVIIGCIICSSITFMYNYCILPGIKDRTVIEEVNSWIKFSPFTQNWYIIILFAIVIEHFSILAFNLLKKYYIELHKDGFVPEFFPEIVLNNIKQDEKIEECEIEPIFTKEIKTTDSKAQSLDFMQENITTNHSKHKPKLAITKDTEIKDDSNNIINDKQITTDKKPQDKIENSTEKINSTNNHDENQIILYDGVNPETDYFDNFTISNSETAGASLPLIIPTSKNYDLRFDADGNVLSINNNISSLSDFSSNTNDHNDNINNISISDVKIVDNKENEKAGDFENESKRSVSANHNADDGEVLKEKKLHLNNHLNTNFEHKSPVTHTLKPVRSIKSSSTKLSKEHHHHQHPAHSPIKNFSRTPPLSTANNSTIQGHDTHSTKSKNSAMKSIKSTSDTVKKKKKTIFGKIKF